MRSIVIYLFILIFSTQSLLAEKPALVVNIIVSQMRYDHITRFSGNFSDRGINKILREGIEFTDARYNFMQTTTPAGLATITTGAEPSTHGIVSSRWIDYTSNRTVELIADGNATGLGTDPGVGRFSHVNITVPTLGDKLKEESPGSKVVTIAIDPVSAIVTGGKSSDVYWLDRQRGSWVSSTAYAPSLPAWVSSYNELRIASQYSGYNWNLLLHRDRYLNTSYSVFDIKPEKKFKKIVTFDFLRSKQSQKDINAMVYSPVGNILLTEFAKQAIMNEQLGANGNTDILNICFDTPRYIASVFGSESVEVEDMIYRLDEDIANLLDFIYQRIGSSKVLIVLTSDHGASDSFDYGISPKERFNSSQFKVIVNGFMNAQYGSGDWVVDYCDRQLYLNRNLIYTRGLGLEEVQNRVAAFVLQFRGVSHVLTSTALQNSSFSGSYAEKMQNSFYPRRAGDLTINLMPGWIEEFENIRSSSGSMYEYDTHVPLMILGPKFYGQKVTRNINMTDLAPTLARIMHIGRPIAAEGQPIEEITRLY